VPCCTCGTGAGGIRESRKRACQSALSRDGLVGRRGSISGMGSGVGALVGSRREVVLVLEREDSSSVSMPNEGGKKNVECGAKGSSACAGAGRDV
jgi:hypothetical protein